MGRALCPTSQSPKPEFRNIIVIAVIDNGICNLRSVTKALETVGGSPIVVRLFLEGLAVAPRVILMLD